MNASIDYSKYILCVIDETDAEPISKDNPLFAMTRHSIRDAILAAFEMERTIENNAKEGEARKTTEQLADEATGYLIESIRDMQRLGSGGETIH